MNKVMRMATGLAASMMLVAGPALAEEEEGEAGFMGKTLDWITTDTYVGLQLGAASADTSEGELANSLTTATNINSVSIDDGGLGYRLFFGKRFTDHVAVELGFADLGDIDVAVDASSLDTAAYLQQLADNTPVAPAGIVIDVVGSWSFADFGSEGEWAEKVSLFGRLGLFLWETEVKYRNAGVTYTGDDDGTDLHFGLGASYRINENFDVRFEYESYQSTTESSIIGLGVAYHF